VKRGSGDCYDRSAQPQAYDRQTIAHLAGLVAAIERVPKAELADADLRDPSLYINRELSMLDFFERVLDEARDPLNPLLERVKFVGIIGSILGEFFMVRIAGLRQQVEAGVTEESADGYTPQRLLPLVRERAWQLMKDARQCFSELLPELEAAGIHIVGHDALDEQQRAALRDYFDEQVYPVLTPLAFDPVTRSLTFGEGAARYVFEEVR